MRLLCLLLALGAVVPMATGQDAEPRLATPEGVAWWADVSAGIEAAPLFAGFGAHVSAGRQFAVRLGIDSSVELVLGTADPTSVQAVSLSGGIRARRGRVHLGTYAGPSLVWGLSRVRTERPSRGRDPYLTAGVALNGSAIVEVGAGIGLGVDVSANVNPEVSTVGARLTTHVRLNRAQ